MRTYISILILMLLSVTCFADIVINELHYNPAGEQGSDDDFEFLELYNNGTATVDMTNWTIADTSAATPETFSAQIPAGGYVVIAYNDTSYSHLQCPVIGMGTYFGLGNSGKHLELKDDSGNLIDNVDYGVTAPWPTAPNGGGSSLELNDPSMDNNVGANWHESLAFGGTPGAQNSMSAFSADVTTGDAPLTVQFTAISWGTPTGYSWDFDNDGTEDDTTANPSFVYANAGTYSVKLVITYASGSEEVLKTDYIIVNHANSSVVYFEDFEANGIDNMTTVSVVGAQEWTLDTQNHGVDNSNCAKMSGYQGGANANEDWLITPPIDLTNYVGASVKFYTAKGYTGDDIVVYASSDFNGDVTTATWTPLQAAISGGNWNWTLSGIIDATSFAGGNFVVAFKFTSTDQESATWEVDNIEVTAWTGTANAENVNDARVFAVNNYPNPFNPTTNIAFSLKKDAMVSVNVYNVKGQLVKTFAEENYKAGERSVRWNGKDNNNNDVTSGVYFYKVQTEETSVVKKMVMIK